MQLNIFYYLITHVYSSFQTRPFPDDEKHQTFRFRGEIMEFDIYMLLIDVMWASILLFVAKWMREKSKVLQSLFIPVSLLAGFLGLILGKNGLNLIRLSSQAGSYAGLLVMAVFASMGLRGFNLASGGFRKNFDRLGSFYCYRQIGWCFQYSIPVAFSVLVLTLIAPGLNPAFGMLVPAGFQGGHGTAAALGKTLLDYGWSDATDLAMTCATVGILVGVFGGIIIIKYATKKGYTSCIKDFGQLPKEMRTGLVEKENRVSIGEETVSPMALDPLAWHFLLIMIPTGLGHLLSQYISKTTGFGLPNFSVGFLLAIAFNFLLHKTHTDNYIDKHALSRVGSSCVDFLVFFGVATINVPVVIQYALPFTLLMIFATAWVVFQTLVLAPRLLRTDWFEHNIYTYGGSTGVVAIGMALLRIADPNGESCTMDDVAIVTPIEAIIEVFALAAVPVACVQGHWILGIAPILGYMAALIIASIVFKWWHKHPGGLYQEGK